MADFLPFFSVTPINLYQINILLAKMAASYSSVLDLGRQIEESKFPRTILKCSFTFNLF